MRSRRIRHRCVGYRQHRIAENYPIDTAALAGEHELAITEFTTREYNHYPLAVQVQPGRELRVRVEYGIDVLDAAGIESLLGRFKRVLVAMTAEVEQQS